MQPAQAKTVQNDRKGAETHGRRGNHGTEQQAEERVKHPRRHRNTQRVVEKGEDQVLPDIPHRGAAEADGLGDATQVAKLKELLDTLDTFIPDPKRETDKPFLMSVEDVFSIKGRGTVATGRIEQGKIKINEEVELIGIHDTRKVVVTGVEMFHKMLDEGLAGDNVGLLLRGIERDEIERGQVLAKPGSITPHTNFEAEMYVLTKEEGGRHTPFFKGYKPQFYIRTTDVTGTVELPANVEMVMPGDEVKFVVTLGCPIALDNGTRFAIREGGRTVGAGVVTKVLK